MTTPRYDLAQELFRFHKIISRALEVSLQHGATYLEAGLPEAPQLIGYSRYVHCLSAILNGHHLSEDNVVFPDLRKVLPLAPYEQLATDHQRISKALDAFPGAIKELGGENPKGGVEIIMKVMDKISLIWYTHIQIEEEVLSTAALNKVLTEDEQKHIGEITSKYSQERSNPPNWVLPFILFNLEAEEREKIVANIPPMVINELIPKAWKEEWSPMRPFLLD